MTLFIHIGLHKTGTTSLQEFLSRNAGLLADLGYAYPKAARYKGGHHNLPHQVAQGRYDPQYGSLQDCMAQADAAPHAILSSEEFEFLSADHVRLLREKLGSRPARIIVYLRRQDELIASTYGQQVRMGAPLPAFQDYVSASLEHPRFDFPSLLARWTDAFGEESLQVGVISDEIRGPTLIDHFLASVGLADATDSLPKIGQSMNRSPGWANIELIRRVTAALRAQGVAVGPQMKVIAAAVAAHVRTDPKLPLCGRLRLSPVQWRSVARRFAPGNAEVARRFIASPVQAQALAFATKPEPVRPPREARLQKAIPQILAALARDPDNPLPAGA